MVPKPFLRYFLLFLKAGWDEEAGKERPWKNASEKRNEIMLNQWERG